MLKSQGLVANFLSSYFFTTPTLLNTKKIRRQNVRDDRAPVLKSQKKCSV